jgi:hypothetical protein
VITHHHLLPKFQDKRDKADKQRLIMADGTRSDHLMFINGFNGWSQAGKNAEKKEYCQDNFLSNYAMWVSTKAAQEKRKESKVIGF